jgi:rhamnosyltransferase
MSSYNGENYIVDQINSIIKQEKVIVELIIRDDGSKDETVTLIKKMQKLHKNIRLIESDNNIGCEKSFFELLYLDGIEADYYAFADQDDVWENRKLYNSISKISNSNTPSLVATNLLACDEKLNPIRIIHSKNDIDRLRFRVKYNYLANMQGCVLLWNRELNNLLRGYRQINICAHDVWVCAVANSIGEFRIVEEPQIKYRIHSNNTSGLALNSFERLRKGIRLYIGKNHPQRDVIANDLLIGYSQYMDHNSIGYINLVKLANYKKNLRKKAVFLTSSYFNRVKWKDVLFWKFCVVLNKY